MYAKNIRLSAKRDDPNRTECGYFQSKITKKNISRKKKCLNVNLVWNYASDTPNTENVSAQKK